MPAPDLVVVGHAVRDLAPNGWRLGGTVTFAAVQAHRLGLSVGVVTRAAPDLDLTKDFAFAQVVQRPSVVSTTFENVYEGGHRRQKVRAKGEPIAAADVPEDWRDPKLVLIGPVLAEVPPDFARVFSEASLVGVSAQGWLRSLDDDGNVRRSSWEGPPFWHGADVLFVSDEDLEGGGERELDAWTSDVPVVAMTLSHKGARIYADGGWRSMPAFPETEVDPTGAGDTFATGFLIRLHETGDPAEAARFGSAAASLMVGGIGVAAMPYRLEIEERMRQYPEVALR
jgi:sugar/nucleoside kinase (ribokinase family)